MDVSFLTDPRMSWAAKGLYCWLLTQGPAVAVKQALAVCPDQAELKSALEELSRLNLMQMNQPLFALGEGKAHEA